MKPIYPLFKSFVDRVFALLLLILFLPLLLSVSLLIRLNLGTPVLFCQYRPGLFCKPFKLFKFRSMSNACDQAGLLLPDSQRLTRLGRWLRATSIDELPALINILRGDMSFIGPRPLLMQYLPLYSPQQARRHEVKPGFSGWAQINGRNAITWEEKFRMDVWYVENRSMLLDLKIFFVTILKVFSRKGVNAKTGGIMPNFKGSQSSTDSQ